MFCTGGEIDSSFVRAGNRVQFCTGGESIRVLYGGESISVLYGRGIDSSFVLVGNRLQFYKGGESTSVAATTAGKGKWPRQWPSVRSGLLLTQGPLASTVRHFSFSHISVLTLLRCSYRRCVQPHASTSVKQFQYLSD